MTHPGTILTTDGTDGTDAGPRSLVLSLSGQLANHKEHKERKAGKLGKGRVFTRQRLGPFPQPPASLCALCVLCG